MLTMQTKNEEGVPNDTFSDVFNVAFSSITGSIRYHSSDELARTQLGSVRESTRTVTETIAIMMRAITSG